MYVEAPLTAGSGNCKLVFVPNYIGQLSPEVSSNKSFIIYKIISYILVVEKSDQF